MQLTATLPGHLQITATVFIGILTFVGRWQSKLDTSKAPGWGSLLPQTKLGVDEGLQCPMCTDSGSRTQTLVSSKIVSSRY